MCIYRKMFTKMLESLILESSASPFFCAINVLPPPPLFQSGSWCQPFSGFLGNQSSFSAPCSPCKKDANILIPLSTTDAARTNRPTCPEGSAVKIDQTEILECAYRPLWPTPWRWHSQMHTPTSWEWRQVRLGKLAAGRRPYGNVLGKCPRFESESERQLSSALGAWPLGRRYLTITS